MQPILSLHGLVKRYGGLLVTDNVDLEVMPGEIHAIIGPNGAGKTTLISQIMGEVISDDGAIYLAGKPIHKLPVAKRIRAGLGRSYQITSVIQQFTVLENVLLAVQGCQGHGYKFWTPVIQAPDLVPEATALLNRLGLSTHTHSLASSLSYGQQRQLEIAMALAAKPKVLLLDEPMAGMGHGDTGSDLMLSLLAELKSQNNYGILLIEHDMDAVFSLADRISVLFYGKIIFSGSAKEIRNSQVVQEAYLGDGDTPV